MLELNFNPFPVLKTERLTLRRITLHDSRDIFDLRTSADAMWYIGKMHHQTLDESNELIRRIETDLMANKAVAWGLSFHNQTRIIGTIGYHKIEREHFSAEIGYMLLPEFWNKGLMTEAIEGVLNYGFNTIKLHSIQANIDPGNERSKAILKKFKFIKEAHFKENYFFNGKFLDSAIYSLLNK